MKSGGVNFFSSLFGGGKERKAEADASEQEIFVNSYSQPHVLREKMKQQKMTHGEVVLANLSPVRLEGISQRMALYFCPVENLDVVKTLEAGDGKDIPMEATVEGLSVPLDFKSGLYALKNVKLTSNGKMQVVATPDTVWESIPTSSAL
jgi:hypothetical protein